MLVTGKPCHSESNGVETRNRTVEDKISNWMHENNSPHWAQALPFIQWCCNTQIHRAIGNRTPYHMMSGQHPHVGISNLPIDPFFLSNLAMEVEVCQSLGLPDTPLEEVNLVNSLGPADGFKILCQSCLHMHARPCLQKQKRPCLQKPIRQRPCLHNKMRQQQ